MKYNIGLDLSEISIIESLLEKEKEIAFKLSRSSVEPKEISFYQDRYLEVSKVLKSLNNGVCI